MSRRRWLTVWFRTFPHTRADGREAGFESHRRRFLRTPGELERIVEKLRHAPLVCQLETHPGRSTEVPTWA